MAYIYDPSKVLIDWGGAPLVGFTEGTFIDVAFTSPAFKTTVGIDGAPSFIPRHDLSGTCTIRLQQGSFGNELLTKAMKTFEDSLTELNTRAPTKDITQANLTIEDQSGTFNWTLNNSVIIKEPDISFGKLASDGVREWVFFSPLVTYKEVAKRRTSEGATEGTYETEAAKTAESTSLVKDLISGFKDSFL